MNDNRLVFIGSGVTNIATIDALLTKLEGQRFVMATQKISMDVFDIRAANFWGGKAYKESAPEMLMQTDLTYFDNSTPDDSLIGRYCAWLRNSKDEWVEYLQETESQRVLEWLDKHKNEIENGKLDDLRPPRAVFGLFLDHEYIKIMLRAKALGVDINLLQAEVSDIKELSGGKSLCRFHEPARYLKPEMKGKKITYIETGKTLDEMEADHVFVAAGLPVNMNFPAVEGNAGYFASHLDCVNGKQTTLKEQILAKYAKTGRKVSLAAIGSGPAFMDLIILLDDPAIRDKVSITCYSRSNLPISYEEDEPNYVPNYIADSTRFESVADFESKFAAEVEYANSLGFTRSGAIRTLQKWTLKKANTETHAPEIVKSIKAVTSYYYNYTLDCVASLDRLDVKNLLCSIKPNSVQEAVGGFCVTANNTTQFHDLLANCTGFGSPSHHPLLGKLIASDQLKISDYFGTMLLELDIGMQARPGLTIAGLSAINRSQGSCISQNDDSSITRCLYEAQYAIAGVFNRLVEKARRADIRLWDAQTIC